LTSTLTILALVTLLVLAGIAAVVNHRRWRRRLEEREAELEERIRGLQERQTAQVERLERERDRIEETGHLEMADDLLSVLDDFDNALANYEDLDDEDREGLEMIRRKLRRTLDDHGIERIEPEEADEFDPERHKALRAVDPEEADPGTVVRTHRSGYRFEDRVLRPAAVDVAVGRDSEEDDPPEDPEHPMEAGTEPEEATADPDDGEPPAREGTDDEPVEARADAEQQAGG